MQTKTLKITAIERAENSRNGNARYDLEFEHGEVYRTAADSSYADVIGNPGYREGDVVTITLTNHQHPKISRIERPTPREALAHSVADGEALLATL